MDNNIDFLLELMGARAADLWLPKFLKGEDWGSTKNPKHLVYALEGQRKNPRRSNHCWIRLLRQALARRQRCCARHDWRCRHFQKQLEQLLSQARALVSKNAWAK